MGCIGCCLGCIKSCLRCIGCMIVCIILFLTVCAASFFIYCIVADQTGSKERHCECIDYDCGCCSYLEMVHVIDGRLCSNFSYLPHEHGVAVTISYNDKTLVNETVSVRNPPSICLLEVEELEIQICFRFHDLDYENKCFSGCAEFEIEFLREFTPVKIELGCFGCRRSPSITTQFHNVLNHFKYKVVTAQDKPSDFGDLAQYRPIHVK